MNRNKRHSKSHTQSYEAWVRLKCQSTCAGNVLGMLDMLGYVLNLILLKNNILGMAWYALGIFTGWLSVLTAYIKMLSFWSQFFFKEKNFSTSSSSFSKTFLTSSYKERNHHSPYEPNKPPLANDR